MEPVAYVAVGASASQEVVRLLQLAGVHTSTSEVEAGHLSVTFNGHGKDASSPWSTVVANTRSNSLAYNYDNPYAAACFVVSCALGLEHPFLTVDPETFAVVCAALRAGRSRSDIALEGETGTGKESLVNLIHSASADGSTLLRVDCASDLTESHFELISAAASEDGARESGDGNPAKHTIFLDRITELSLPAQSRLLDIIGSSETTRRPRVRCVAATTHSLAHSMQNGLLLPQLRERFQISLSIPPIRQRRGDILMLTRYFLDLSRSPIRLSPGALKILCEYPFPGNVRELQSLATRLAILAPAGANGMVSRPHLLGILVEGNLGLGVDAPLWQLAPPALRLELLRRAVYSSSGDAWAAERFRILEPYTLANSGGTPSRRSRKPRSPGET